MTKPTALKREIAFTPAFDKRHSDPKKNYGIHGVEMRWYVRGPKGTIQFVVMTGWDLPAVRAERKGNHRTCDLFPMPSDLGYHSPRPMYEDQSPMNDKCEMVEGGVCYYDGSSLGAESVFDLLVKEGHESVWRRLEQEYRKRFDD